MNRLRGKNLMSVALIALLILNMYAVIQSKAQEDLYPTDVSIQPPSISWTYPEHDLLETFEVTLSIQNVTDLWGWQAGLYFNPNVLNVTYFKEGPFLKQGGGTFWLRGTIDNATGVITYFASTLLAPATPVSGSGDLAYIGFQVINYGNPILDLTTTDDDPAELILVDPDVYEIPCDVYDGYFELPPLLPLPPGAYFTFSPISPFAWDTVTFDSTTSIDGWSGTGWSPITTWDWDFGDGTNDTGKVVTHAYAAFGTYAVNLTITDSEGLTDSFTYFVTVYAPPFANFTFSPLSPLVGESVTFDASASNDLDGTIIGWDWDFGDGDFGTGEIVTHAYTTAGTYTVALRVTDNDNLTDTDWKSVTIKKAPVASFTYSPEAPTVNEDVMFDASGSTPDGGELIDPTSYAWDFGDGTTGGGEIVTHTYSVARDYNVTLTITDNHGLLDTYSKIITVSTSAYSIHPYALAAAVIVIVILIALTVYLVKTRKLT